MTSRQDVSSASPSASRATIAVDAMGGDSAPSEVVEGVIRAVRESASDVVLVGDEGRVSEAVRQAANGEKLSGIRYEHASQVIEMGESPAVAVKGKKDSSIVVAARLVRERRAAAMVSAGNTGACMMAALLGMGRLKGVQRPALAVPIPRAGGITTVIDAGANVDSRPMHLAQSAVMGEIYAEQILGIRNPRIGLLNVGEEEGKGTEVVCEAYALLSGLNSNFNFIGNVEGRDIVSGHADVIVCDGFVGNIVLKMAEGMGAAIPALLRECLSRSGLLAKFGMLLSRPVFREFKKLMDPAAVGGAPLLGVDGTCIVGHGASSPLAIRNAIAVAERFVGLKVNDRIQERLDSLQLTRTRQE